MNETRKKDKFFMSKFQQYKKYIINLIVPAVIFGFVTGTLTSFVVTLYNSVCCFFINLTIATNVTNIERRLI